MNNYIEETSRSAEWKPATEKEYRSLGKMTSFILGPDLPVSSIDHQTVNRLKEVLQKIPSGAFRYNQFRNISKNYGSKRLYIEKVGITRPTISKYSSDRK